MIKIGCAWLAKPGQLTSGWASIDGGEPFKFSDLDYLRSKGPIWVTQCPKATFISEGGGRFPWLRHGEYLTTPLTFLAEEMAVTESPQRACVVLSEILTRMVGMCCEIAPGLDQLLLDSQQNTRDLHELMQQVIAPAGRKLELPADLQDALPKLFSSFASKDSAYNDLLVRVPAARVKLFEKVMQSPVPGDTWEEIPPELYPNPLTWAANGDHPIIAKVLVAGRAPQPREKGRDKDQNRDVQRDLAVFHGIANGTRRWMALPEIRALSRVFTLKAERTFLCESIMAMGSTLKIAPPIFSPVAYASISAALTAETFLSASACPSPILNVASNGAPACTPYSIRSVWVQSLVREAMIDAAIACAENRQTVQGVGFDHLILGTRKDRLRGFRHSIKRNDYLSYPSGLRAKEERYAPQVRAVLSADATGEADQEEMG